MGNKPRRRDVTPSKKNGWDVRAPGSSRASSRHGTQQEAIDAGRRILKNQGGGELRVKGRDGRVREQDTIPRGKDPRRSKG